MGAIPMIRGFTLLAAILCLLSCGKKDAGDAIPAPCPGGDTLTLEVDPPGERVSVDVLVVFNNSMSMIDAGAGVSLAAALPSLLGAVLEAPAQLTPEVGAHDINPDLDVHVGIVTTDMGTAGHDVSGGFCTDLVDGDNAELMHEAVSSSLCDIEIPSYLEVSSSSTTGDLELAARRLACNAALYEPGCAFSQPFKAARVALSADHNEGFLRDDSLLVVIVVMDEDDCSIAEGSEWFFDPLDSTLGPIPLRCFSNDEAKESAGLFVDSLRSLRPDPGGLLVAFIAGVPQGERCEGTGDAIPDCLDHPDMDAELDPTGRPEPACALEETYSYPSIRIVQAAHSLGEDALVRSFCRDDWAPIMRQVGDVVADRVYGAPLAEPLPLARDDDPCLCLADCALVEELAGAGPCHDGWDCYEPGGPGTGCATVEREDGTHALCTLEQIPTRLEDCTVTCDHPDASRSYGGEHGWIYAPVTPDGPRVLVTSGPDSAPGSSLFLSCCL
jgi:hypothetical protein